MPAFQLLEGGSNGKDGWTILQKATFDYLHSRRLRMLSALITASAILTPWVISSLSRALGFGPVGHHRERDQKITAGILLGFTDAVRAGSIALYVMANDALRNWPRIKAGAPSPAASREASELAVNDSVNDDYGSVGEALRSRRLKPWSVIAWLLAGLVGVSILAYLEGRARRGN